MNELSDKQVNAQKEKTLAGTDPEIHGVAYLRRFQFESFVSISKIERYEVGGLMVVLA